VEDHGFESADVGDDRALRLARTRRSAGRRIGGTVVVGTVAALAVATVLFWLLFTPRMSRTSGANASATSSTMPASPVAQSEQSATPSPSAAATAVPETSGAETLPAVLPRIVELGSGKSKRVALTFDLCERDNDAAGYEPRIASTLRAMHAKATFFMGGLWAIDHPGPAKDLGANPLFEIGNHSYSHEHLPKIAQSEVTSEIVRAQEAVFEATGRTPRLFRFPYGEFNRRTLRRVGEQGLVAVQWSVVTGDPDRNISAKDILHAVQTRTKNGAIIIMHANGRGWHTPEALPGVIDWLRAHGYELVTVSELLR
jgi:peptidoglycan-N-acetylglucosamine deacetylase